MRRATCAPRPGLVPVRSMPAYDDDLRLAHVLADAADALTMSPLQGRATCGSRRKPDLTPVTDADRGAEEAIRRPCCTGPTARRRASARSSAHRARAAALGDRPDRRHQELRPRRAGVGDPDRADGRRRGRWSAWSRARRSAGAGGPGAAGRLDRASLLAAQPAAGLRVSTAGGRVPVVLQPRRLGEPAARRLPGPDPDVLADPRLRRLLVVHAGRRGRRRHRRRAGAGAATTWPRCRRSSRRRAAGSPTSTAGRGPPAATPSPPTGCCTTRCSPADAATRAGVSAAGGRSGQRATVGTDDGSGGEHGDQRAAGQGRRTPTAARSGRPGSGPAGSR